MRSSNGWGVDHGAWRPAELPGHADLLHGDVPAAGGRQRRADDPLRVPLAEPRVQRHDPLEQLVVQRRRAASNDTLYGQGLDEDASTLSGYVAATGTTPEDAVQMYEIPFGKMIQPRARRDLGRTTATTRSSPATPSTTRPPARCRVPRRGIATSRPRQRALRRQRRAVRDRPGRLLIGQAVRRRPDAAAIDEFLYRHRAAVRAAAGRAALYGRYREGSHFWEDTNNNARVAFKPPAGIPRELYIPDLAAQLAQIGSGSTLRHRRARRRLHQVLRG